VGVVTNLLKELKEFHNETGDGPVGGLINTLQAVEDFDKNDKAAAEDDKPSTEETKAAAKKAG
jgi:hypothetical protein